MIVLGCVVFGCALALDLERFNGQTIRSRSRRPTATVGRTRAVSVLLGAGIPIALLGGTPGPTTTANGPKARSTTLPLICNSPATLRRLYAMLKTREFYREPATASGA